MEGSSDSNCRSCSADSQLRHLRRQCCPRCKDARYERGRDFTNAYCLWHFPTRTCSLDCSSNQAEYSACSRKYHRIQHLQYFPDSRTQFTGYPTHFHRYHSSGLPCHDRSYSHHHDFRLHRQDRTSIRNPHGGTICGIYNLPA